MLVLDILQASLQFNNIGKHLLLNN